MQTEASKIDQDVQGVNVPYPQLPSKSAALSDIAATSQPAVSGTINDPYQHSQQ